METPSPSLMCIAPSDIEFAVSEVERMLRKMPHPYGYVLRESFFEGKSAVEIGESLSLGAKRIYQIRKHALLNLRRHYLYTQNFLFKRNGLLLREALDVFSEIGFSISEP